MIEIIKLPLNKSDATLISFAGWCADDHIVKTPPSADFV
jgi:hypothetical protein